jgi:hypothetical protein
VEFKQDESETANARLKSEKVELGKSGFTVYDYEWAK